MSPSTPAARAPSRTSALAVLVFLLLICSPCLGLGGGLAYLRLEGQGALARWRPLAALPETAVAFVTADPNRVYVSTVSGQVYVCRHNAPTDGQCWLLAEEPYTIASESDFEHSVFTGQVPPPPGDLIDTVYVSIFYGDAAFEARYALLADGSVWVWEYSASSNMALLVLLAGPVIGLVLGVLVALALLVIAAVRRRRAAAPG